MQRRIRALGTDLGETCRLASLSLAALVLWGCESGTSTGPEPVTFLPPAPTGQGFAALYAPPPYNVVPYPNDIYNPVAAGLGSTLNVPTGVVRPLAAAVNTLDGFSTVAKITAPFNAPIDTATLIPFNPLAPTGSATVYVLNASRGAPLVPGVDYSVGLSDETGTNGSVLEITPLIDAAVGLLRIPGGSVAVAWSATTQSVSEVLEAVRDSAGPMPHKLAPLGITTADLGLGLPGAATLYSGWIQIPYYGDPADVLGSFWVNSDFMPPTAANPQPLPRGGLLRIPVLASLPTSGVSRGGRGWPVVLFQHGVTSNRTSMIAIADAFALGGFGMVAIDLPLHGVTDTSNHFYQGPGSPFGDNERHFNLDNVGSLGSLVPDGQIDDGWQIFNIGNPLNARDHARQTISDLFHLARTVPELDFDGDSRPDLDADRVHFVGVSLGAIFSVPFVALNPELSTATLSSAGGPLTQFLVDPMAITFGAPLRAGVEAAGLPFGTVGFSNFIRDLQTVLDSIDPVNYAAVAASVHPIHMVGVLDDTAVPMTLINNVAQFMGLSDISSTTIDPGGVRGIVRFNRGGHGAILNPADLAVTVEMQTQAVTFAGSGGTIIPIGNSGIVQ